MPSTRRQRAKARQSRELDMKSDLDNLDIMLGKREPQSYRKRAS